MVQQDPCQQDSSGENTVDVKYSKKESSYSPALGLYDTSGALIPPFGTIPSTSYLANSLSIQDLCRDRQMPSAYETAIYAADADIQLAIEALGGLRNGTSPCISNAATQSSLLQSARDAVGYGVSGGLARAMDDASMVDSDNIPPPLVTCNDSTQNMRVQPECGDEEGRQQPFLRRMSNILPLVNRISTVYEATKNASTVVKYSAESVESGVKTIARPVLDKLEPALTPLDRFACSQLDKLERSFPYIIGSSTNIQYECPESTSHSRSSSVDILAPPSISLTSDIRQRLPSSNAFLAQPLTDQPFMASATNIVAYGRSADTPVPNASSAPHVERKPRSRWHQVVAGVGVNLGMITDDAMRTLRHFLQYIQYSIKNMNHNIHLLKTHLLEAGGAAAKLVTGIDSPTPPLSPTSGAISNQYSDNLMSLVQTIKREIVSTLRKVVDLVSRQAAMHLPGDARQIVRGFILNLPARLASLTQGQRSVTELESANGFISGIVNESVGDAGNAINGGEQPEVTEARNLLTLASESASMLQGIESVFAQTLDVSQRVFGEPAGNAMDVNGGDGTSVVVSAGDPKGVRKRQSRSSSDIADNDEMEWTGK